MGGHGSGRWGAGGTRAVTDGPLRLDVRWLARQGCLGPNTTGSYVVGWLRGDEPAGDILVRYDADRPAELVLTYHARRGEGGPWRPIRERVVLDRTPCPYGGERPWFRCPGCDARRAVLSAVDGRFRCRACHDLAYASTREGAVARHRRRSAGLRRRLGAPPGEAGLAAWLCPEKPKGMHWRTYDRITAGIRAHEDAALAALRAEVDALAAQIEREPGRPSRG